jgi:hypothetical protein
MGTPTEHHVAVYRTSTGWRVAAPGNSTVENAPVPADDLLSALVLADLLSADVAPAGVAPSGRPARAAAELDETARLRVAVHQLEHALAARVVVEQAIGVLAERAGTPPRAAFEHLRKVARSHGLKVHDLARDVVSSVTDASVTLPGGLPSRPR